MAANTLMTLLVKLGADTSGYTEGLDKAEGKAKKTGASIVSALSGIGLAVAGGLTVAAGAAIAFLTSTIKPASDLGESMNAVNVIFGDAADVISKYGETAWQTVGLSNVAFNGLATTVGAFLQNVGFDSQAAADETINLTERAADMASVFNTDVSSALAAIQSGLKGEFNPLEQFGVKINAAAIASKALEMGLASTESQLTDTDKAAAALALIYEQTEKTAGDFANTSDGLANSQRQLQGLWENMKARLGSALLPAIEKFAGFMKVAFTDPAVQKGLDDLMAGIGKFASWAVEQIPKVVAAFQAFGAWLSENQGVIVAVLAVIGVSLVALGVTGAIALWGLLAPMLPIIAVIAAIGAAVYLLYEAWTNNWGGIQEAVIALWENNLKPVFEQLKAWLAEALPVALQWLSDIWTNTLLPAIQSVFKWIAENLIPAIGVLIDWLSVNLPLAIAAVSEWWTNVLVPAIQQVWAIFAEKILPIFVSVYDWLAANLPGAIQTLSDFWTNTLLPAIQQVWAWISDTLIPTLVKLYDWYATNMTAGLAVLASFWTDTLLPAIQAVADWITGTLVPVLEDVWEWLSDTLTNALTVLAGFWQDTLLPAIEAVWAFVQDSVIPLFEALVDFFDAAFTLALTALAGLWQNVLQPALEAVWAVISDKLQPIFETLVDIWEGTVQPALEEGAGFLADSFAPALDSISGAISDVIGWLQEMTNMLNNITLPGWLTPGSPTPFEIGLLGISDALKKVAKTSLPDMTSSLNVTGRAGAGLAQVSGNGGLSVDSITINANGLDAEQARQVVISALRELQFEAGAV